MNGLRARRFSRGLTASDVARQAGISLETLSRLENGHFFPSAPTAKKLADFYGVKVPELMADIAQRDDGPDDDLPAAA